MKFKDIDRVSTLTLERGEPPHRAIWRKMHLSGSVDLLISMKPSCIIMCRVRASASCSGGILVTCFSNGKCHHCFGKVSCIALNRTRSSSARIWHVHGQIYNGGNSAKSDLAG